MNGPRRLGGRLMYGPRRLGGRLMYGPRRLSKFATVFEFPHLKFSSLFGIVMYEGCPALVIQNTKHKFLH